MGNNFGMQYIMDGNGNYYTVNSNDQLVVAKDKNEASVFTFFEANQRIGGGKKSRFYQTIPVEKLEDNEEPESTSDNDGEDIASSPVVSKIINIVDKMFDSDSKDEIEPKTVTKPQPEYEYSMENVDWMEFINYYLFLAGGAKGQQEELAKEHSDIEKEICDLLHYVELFDLTDDEALRAMDMLKDARQRRRDVKDEILRIEYFQKMVGTSANVAKARGFLTELKKLDSRKYFPRQLGGLFDGMEDRATDRDLYRQNREASGTNSEEENDDYVCEEEREMSFVETVFDNRDNDWLLFARQQMEFYQNAGQYMTNLQLAISAIDNAIEDMMEEIEDANYNVAQGYKAFKKLKELRNVRKAKAQELEVLKTMTACFDMDAMAEAFENNVDEIEEITALSFVEVEQAEVV